MKSDWGVEASYRLRTVRIGIWATLATVAGLFLFPFLPGHMDLQEAPYFAVLIVALVGVGIIAVLPWRKLVERGWSMWVMYVWSAFDVVLITALIAFGGSDDSSMFLIYALTTIFFAAASYPARAQVALLLFTFASYLAVLAYLGWPLAPAVLVVRLIILAVVAYLSTFLANELKRHMGDHISARRESERRARLLATVARSARSISTLDTDLVLQAVVDSALGLGFEGGNFCFIDEVSRTYAVGYAKGLPFEFIEASHPIEGRLPGLVAERGETVVVSDYESWPGAVPLLRAKGFRVAVATPVWAEGHLEAVLVVGSQQQRTITDQEVEALQLLAAQAGRALENARRYQSERRTAERLAELDRMKRDFLATVSHELRTPLTAIEGLGETMEQRWERLDESRLKEMLGRINANARSLHEIITTLLDFSQLEAGRLTISTRPFDLGEMMESISSRVSGLFVEHDLEVEIEQGLLVEGDPTYIERVVENLLSNAAKHTPGGTVVTATVESNGRHAVAEVSDNGPGIPSDEIPHLGERFFRGGDTDTRRTRGVGLGLALAREILDLHGTHLEVTSEPGLGSTFRFRLPLAAPGVRAPRQESKYVTGERVLDN